jgi:hypothetical protein
MQGAAAEAALQQPLLPPLPASISACTAWLRWVLLGRACLATPSCRPWLGRAPCVCGLGRPCDLPTGAGEDHGIDHDEELAEISLRVHTFAIA